jgi:LmbE family N-acetylglucosaminyl deacetylase
MKIMTILAHPDDAELWAGGTLLRHAKAGDSVTVVTFADDTSSRLAEAHAGAHRMRATCDVRSGAVLQVPERLASELEALLRSAQPDLVITHWIDDTHPAHRVLSDAVLRASTTTRLSDGVPRVLLACDTYGSVGRGGTFEPTLYINITAVFDEKLAAISAHTSQPVERWQEMARVLGRLHGFRSDCTYAEAFRPVPILGIVESMELLPQVGARGAKFKSPHSSVG